MDNTHTNGTIKVQLGTHVSVLGLLTGVWVWVYLQGHWLLNSSSSLKAHVNIGDPCKWKARILCTLSDCSMGQAVCPQKSCSHILWESGVCGSDQFQELFEAWDCFIYFLHLNDSFFRILPALRNLLLKWNVSVWMFISSLPLRLEIFTQKLYYF